MLDSDPANHLADEATDEPTPANAMQQPVADDLPRPPSGRRSAIRPAGPPQPVSWPIPEPVPAELPTEPAEESAAPEEQGVADVAPQAEGPIDVTPGPVSDESTATSDAESVEAPEGVGAQQAPVQEVSTENTQPQQEPSDQPAAMPTDKPAQKRSPRTSRPQTSTEGLAGTSSSSNRRRSGRGKAATESMAQAETEHGASSEIEAALSAVEASPQSRTRRATRTSAAGLIGVEVPTDAAGEVDTLQVLASLAAAIAGRPDGAPAAELEPGTQPAQLEGRPAEAALERGEAVDEAADDQAEEALPEGSTSETSADESDEEQGEQTGGSQARRRRRRGGRRRRRGSGGSGDDESVEDGDQSDEQDEADDGGASDDQPDEADHAGSGSESVGSSNRRRRRRRRRVDDAGGDDDDQGDVAVRVREPRRSITDEISGIDGSTRLEAKKQRRREGRAAGRHRAPILTEAEFLARRESVDRVMLVRQHDDYTQLAVLEDDVLVEHYVDRTTSTSLIGNIYLGRVQNVLPSMEAVFIDIGRGRNAVLYAGEVDWDAFDVSSDARKVEQVFKSGQSVLVQVSKDPVGAKGARLTGHVSIPGRYVVYSPGGHLSGISRKLPDAERHRLKQVLDSVVSEDSSVIVRTAAEGVSAEELVSDVERLKAHWQQIEKKSKQGSAPQQLYAEPDLTLRLIRDTFTEDFKQLIVAGDGGADDAFDQIAGYIDRVAPQLADRLVKWEAAEGDPLAKFRLDEQISKALERKVFLPSGGSLVIDRTEAMTVIDVNTGKFTGAGGNLEETVTRNNLEAAEEIVRQLRLRDLGGIIVIDFIDMVLPSNRDLLLRRLVECLGRDRTRHQVSEVTSLGLVQMTRKRIGTGLAEAFTEPCEHCGGRGYIRHDEPVESQAPADGGERRVGRSTPNGASGNRSRGARVTNRPRTKPEEAAKANQVVQPTEAARQAAAKVAAASRHHVEPGTDTADGTESGAAADEVAQIEAVAPETV